MNTMKLSALAALATVTTLSALPMAALAEDAPSTTFNIGVFSEYRYRGISQSRLQPALQGGADYANPNGFYVGTWASTIKWVKDAGGKADVEVDLYGGYKMELAKDLNLDLGGLYYLYPSNNLNPSANTFELYAALSMGAFTGKYSVSTTNLFGFANSKGSGYLDLSYTADLGDGWSLAPHYGRQDVRHNGNASYNDYALTLGKDLGKGLSVSAALLGTDAKSGVYVSPSNKNLGKSTIVVGLKYGF